MPGKFPKNVRPRCTSREKRDGAKVDNRAMNYRVHRGDTLNGIAHWFHTTVSHLAAENHIHNPNLIHVGQNLKVDSFQSHPAAHHTTTHASSGVSSHGSSKEKKLAAAAHRVALSMGGYHGLGRCATGVSRAIASALGLHVHGNGNQIDNNLPRKHFKQVHMSLAQALKTPGLILTWEHTPSKLGRKYGHTAITMGDGHTSCSDFVERNTLAGSHGRTGLKIFMPI